MSEHKLHYALLSARGALRINGADAAGFLQGLVSNDIGKARQGAAVYAALLTPQGKYLFDFFIVAEADGFVLDCEAGRQEALAKRLSMYRLRAAVEISDAGAEFQVAVLFPANGGAEISTPNLSAGLLYRDPRLKEAGFRALLPRDRAADILAESELHESDAVAYDRFRLGLGLPDGAADLRVDKSTLLESNFEELHGLDFDKGCYVGQEVTARMKYRGLGRKRLLPVTLSGEASAGDAITVDGRNAGELRSSRDGRGLALLRLDALGADKPALCLGDGQITVQTPAWLDLAIESKE